MPATSGSPQCTSVSSNIVNVNMNSTTTCAGVNSPNGASAGQTGSPLLHNSTGLKKPITFATLAAANSNQINTAINSLSSLYTNQVSQSLSSSVNGTANKANAHFNTEKIESVLNEFRGHVYLINCLYSKVSHTQG